jgi:hypothetical protein
MPRTAARFTQADVARAAKAMRAAGCVVTGVRIDRDPKTGNLAPNQNDPSKRLSNR